MANKQLKRLNLSSNIIEKLVKNKIFTCKDFFNKTPFELLHILSCSQLEANEILVKVAKFCSPKFSDALNLLSESKSLTNFVNTGLPSLDEVLIGGLLPSAINEIAGPSGSGKTQFCLQITALFLLKNASSQNSSVIFIDTESTFSASRLLEIIQSRSPTLGDDQISDLLNRVIVFTESTCAGLSKRLELLEETVIERHCGVILIDSIASLVRKEFDALLAGNLAERTNLLCSQASTLKYISQTFNIPVVITNQITTHLKGAANFERSTCPLPPAPPQPPPPSHATWTLGMDSTDHPDHVTQTVSIEPDLCVPTYQSSDNTNYNEQTSNVDRFDLDDQRLVTPALGNTWSHAVNTRLIIQYHTEHRLRQILVAKSPVAPFSSFTFTIEASGLVQTDDETVFYEGQDPGLQHIRTRSATTPTAQALHL